MAKVLVVLLFLFTGFVQADDFSAVEMKLKAAMEADIRTEAEVERDRNRSPVATLEFFGLRDDMKVVELLPGGGWYTKLLAPVMAENGEFYVALGTGRVKETVGIGRPARCRSLSTIPYSSGACSRVMVCAL